MLLDQPPLLTLQRIHRLLRPLRASLTALRAELDQHSARLTSAAALAKAAPARSKPKARAASAAEADEEYTEGPRRKKRRVGRGTRVGQVRRLGREELPASSSPLRQPVSQATDSATAQEQPFRADQPSTKRPSEVLSGPFDFGSYLRNHAASPTLIAKATQLARCYSSILETTYPSQAPTSKSRSSSRRPSPLPPPSHPPPPPPQRTVPTLGELCARQIGLAIEDNVRLCVEEASEMREASVAASQESRRGGRRQGSRLPSPDEEDATVFQDEWYAACPAHALRHVLVEHATCILVDGLDGALHVVVNAFFELALAAGAKVEATRFWPTLCQAGLVASTPTSSAHALLARTQSTPQFFDCLATLEATLLESSFSDRLFYAPFLSLGQFPLRKSQAKSPTSLTQVVYLLEMEVRVGGMMLEAVQEARDAGERGGEAIIRDIVGRLEKELATGLQLVIRGGAKYGLVMGGVDELGSSVFELIDQFAEDTAALRPISAALELDQLRQPSTTEDTSPIAAKSIIRLRTLEALASATSSSSDDGSHSASPVAPLLAALAPLLRYSTSADFLVISQTLSRAGLVRMDSALLERVLESHSSLVDVRAARGGRVVEAAVLEERLALATGNARPLTLTASRMHARTPADHLSSEASHPLSQSYSPLLARSKLGRPGQAAVAVQHRMTRPPFTPRFAVAESVDDEEDLEQSASDDEGMNEEGDEEEAVESEMEGSEPPSPCRSRSSTASNNSSVTDCTADSDTASDTDTTPAYEPSLKPQPRPRALQPLRRRATEPTTRHERKAAAQPARRVAQPPPRRRRSALPFAAHDDDSSEDELLL